MRSIDLGSDSNLYPNQEESEKDLDSQKQNLMVDQFHNTYNQFRY